MRGFIQPRLLFLLAQHPAHGYELMEILKNDDRLASADAGNLYRMLNNLEGCGFIKSQWNASESGPARKVYALTEAGRADLAAWMESLRRAQKKLVSFIAEYEEFSALQDKQREKPKK